MSNAINSLDSDSSESSEESPAPDGTEPVSTEPVSVEEIQKSLEAKTQEAQGLQDKYLRLAAEFEKYKRLAQRDQREHIRFGNEGLLKELLPVIDNLERAIRSSQQDANGAALLQGIELTLKHALEAMGKFGVRQMTSVGEPFDPARHQAVVRVESDRVPEDSVVEEYQRGYYVHERVLRPAMVSVAVSASTPQEQNGTTGEPAEGSEEKP